MWYEKGIDKWEIKLHDLDLEINLGGDSKAAYPVNVDISNYINLNFKTVLEKAAEYISTQFDSPNAIKGKPDPAWVDIGLNNYGEHKEFTFFFSDDDTYTLWSVIFSCQFDQGAVSEIYPVGFGRRAW